MTGRIFAFFTGKDFLETVNCFALLFFMMHLFLLLGKNVSVFSTRYKLKVQIITTVQEIYCGKSADQIKSTRYVKETNIKSV